MIVYIEGVDGTGKTTFAKALYEKLKKEKIFKKVEPDGEALIPTKPKDPKRLKPQELHIKFVEMAEDLNTLYICDRGPLSDIIYRTFDNYTPVVDLITLSTMIAMSGPKVFLVHCDTADSFTNMMTRGETNPTSINFHKALKKLYRQIIPTFRVLPAVEYDMAKHDLDGVITILLERLKLAKDSLLNWKWKR